MTEGMRPQRREEVEHIPDDKVEILPPERREGEQDKIPRRYGLGGFKMDKDNAELIGIEPEEVPERTRPAVEAAAADQVAEPLMPVAHEPPDVQGGSRLTEETLEHLRRSEEAIIQASLPPESRDLPPREDRGPAAPYPGAPERPSRARPERREPPSRKPETSVPPIPASPEPQVSQKIPWSFETKGLLPALSILAMVGAYSLVSYLHKKLDPVYKKMNSIYNNAYKKVDSMVTKALIWSFKWLGSSANSVLQRFKP